MLNAVGLAPLIGLTPASRYFPLIFAAALVEGIGTGLGGPAILRTVLGGALPSDTGAASAAHSTAGQLGSSVGAALLSTIAATATVAYLASHPGATIPTATDHGYAVAMAWGVGILLVTAVPVAFLVNAQAPRRSRG